MDKKSTKYAWQFAGKMEGFTDQELKERIQKGMDGKLEHEIRPIPYLGDVKQVITHDYDELEALCPVTGIHDVYRIRIGYVPQELIPELKSLKFYFWNFRTWPISHEHLAARIYHDFIEAIKPSWLNLYLDVAPRGEIFSTVTIEKSTTFTINNFRPYDKASR